VPVIVVGNITAGGTGKTPLVVWLAVRLLAAGYAPGIVSRGHGGRRRGEPLRVGADTAPEESGDEALLLARRTGCPVVVARDRCAAVEALHEGSRCDLVIADDGLQHYALARDMEVLVLDGRRGIGNGLRLPAGPLREGTERLAEVDWVVSTDVASALCPEATVMRLTPRRFVRLDAQAELDCETFVRRHGEVNAVAGIGNPERFFATLTSLGLTLETRALPDHHAYRGAELEFANAHPVVTTEKDAVKLERLGALRREVWYLEVDAELEAVAGETPEAKLSALLRIHGVQG